MFNENVKNLMFDLVEGREIFDAEQNRVVSKAEANDAIRNVIFEKLGLTKDSTAKEVRRAFKRPEALEVFAVIEENVDQFIATGWTDNEFFSDFVEMRNLKDGDRNDFVTEEDVILNVATVAGDHHDLTVQRLGKNASYSVSTSVYAVKVGGDIRMFLAGRQDWATLISAIARAFNKKIMDTMYAEFANAATKLPAQFQKGGTAFSSATKSTFDELIEDVEMSNESNVVIMGTKTALKKLNALTEVDWIADSQKEAVANTGYLGNYEGTALLEIPQRFANNDTTTKLVDSTKLYIIPVVDGFKPVKFVDYGESELQVEGVGSTMDDMQTYEVQRRMGVGSVISRNFGVWTIA